MLSPDAFSNEIEDNVSPAGLGFSFAFSAAAAAAASAACFAASAALEMIDGHDKFCDVRTISKAYVDQLGI